MRKLDADLERGQVEKERDFGLFDSTGIILVNEEKLLLAKPGINSSFQIARTVR